MCDQPHWEKSAFLKLARLGAVVFLPTTKGKYLMQVADPDDESIAGKYRPPGGGKDTKDKNLTETIIREIHEEFAIPKAEVRKKVRFLGYEYRDQFWGNAVFEMRDHGLHPGVYQASNDPDEKVKLVEAGLDSKKYVGPDPSKLITEEAKKYGDKLERDDIVVKSARFITYDELMEYGKQAKGKMLRVYMLDPQTEESSSISTMIRDGETPETAAIRTVKELKECDVNETHIERLPNDEDGDKRVRVLLTSETKAASATTDSIADRFKPDFTPEQMEEMGDVQARLYHRLKPRLASMESWPTNWTSQDDHKGWVEWYQQYHNGRRQSGDEKQIKRWLAFKARHGSPFVKHPTPRRAWAMFNWGIDATKLLPEGARKDFRAEMEEFKNRIDDRAKKAAEDLLHPENSQLIKEAQEYGIDREAEEVRKAAAYEPTWRSLDDVDQIPYLAGMHNTDPSFAEEYVSMALDKEAAGYLEDMARRFPPMASGTVGLLGLADEFLPSKTVTESVKEATAVTDPGTRQTLGKLRKLTSAPVPTTNLSQIDSKLIVGQPAGGPPLTGPEAIQFALQNLDLDQAQTDAMSVVKRKLKSKRPDAVKVLGYIDGLKRMGYKPEELMLTRVPVIPPNFRPYSVAGETFVPGAANELYRDLINLIGVHSELQEKLGAGSGFNRLNIYDAVSALYGYGEPTSPKTRERGISGFLKQVTGTNPKFSFFQRKMLSKDQDYVGRSVIGVDPDLGLDEIGVPDDMMWTLYAPYIQRGLVRSGMSPEEALRAIRDRTQPAERMLDAQAKARPVMYSRAPSWHKFNVIAGYPKRIKGDMIRINPLVTTGLNADFDGDTLNVHLPSMPEAVQDAKEKLMPSKMLFSIKDRNKVLPVPKQEFIMGLFNAQRRPAKKAHVFPDEASALAAIKAGQVALSDEVTIKGSKA